MKMGRSKRQSKKWLWVLIIIFVITLASFLFIVIRVPYQAMVVYTVEEPYTDTESYWDVETTQVPYRDCVKSNWLTGKCTEYQTFYQTVDKNVIKQREVTKYRTVEKTGTETRYCHLWERVVGRC